MYRVSSLPRYTDTPTVCTHLCFTFSTVRLQYPQKIGDTVQRAVSRSSSTSRTYEAWSSRATYLCARNCGSSFSVSRENVQPNKECLAEHSALSLTILRKAWLSPQPRGEVSPRTDDVSGLRDFRIPRVTCCLSRYLNIQMLLLNLSWRRYRRLSSISIPFHRHRYIIVLRLIDSYSLCNTICLIKVLRRTLPLFKWEPQTKSPNCVSWKN